MEQKEIQMNDEPMPPETPTTPNSVVKESLTTPPSPSSSKLDVLEGRGEGINLAILANGGKEFRKEMCTCDASVGHCPCEYCAIFEGLRKASNLRSQLQSQEERIRELEKENDKFKTLYYNA